MFFQVVEWKYCIKEKNGTGKAKKKKFQDLIGWLVKLDNITAGPQKAIK